MLEKPNIPDATLIACLQANYSLSVNVLEFLPIGADRNTAVYRAITDTGTSYFVKLRSGVFDEMTIIVPKILYDQGIKRVIAPLSTQSQQLWVSLDDFKVFVFPFVDGLDGYDTSLSDQHWIDFGQTLKTIHTADLPPTIMNRIQRETFSAEWRMIVKKFQRIVNEKTFDDPVANELAKFLKQKQAEIDKLVHRAEILAAMLKTQQLSYTLCHADLHAGNIFIDKDDYLYIVDWDTLILAPKERDLMYAGGGQFVNKRSPHQEETLFYEGYGQIQIDPIALAYYRYERIVQDIAEYCEEVLLTVGDGADRKAGAHQLMNQFLPNQVIDIALKTDKNSPQLY